MPYREYPPHPSLSHAVHCYWTFEHDYAGPRLERMLPDGYIDWVLHYGARPLLLVDGRPSSKPSAFMGGHLLRSVQLSFSGSLHSFGIKFYPWAAPLLYPMPAAELNHRREAVADILRRCPAGLEDWLVNELARGRVAAVLPRLEPLIADWLSPADARDQLLRCVCQLAMRASGQLRVAEIERRSGYSRRYIERTFAEKRGMSLKYFLRLLRLKPIAQQLVQSARGSLAELALTAGYFDQAHFCRDFTALVGVSPTRYQAEQNVYVLQRSPHADSATGSG